MDEAIAREYNRRGIVPKGPSATEMQKAMSDAGCGRPGDEAYTIMVTEVHDAAIASLSPEDQYIVTGGDRGRDSLTADDAASDADEADERSIMQSEGTLGADLYSNHPDAYSALASQIISETNRQPRPVSNSVQEVIIHSALPVIYLDDPDRFDRLEEASPLGSALGKLYCTVCTGAYGVARSEDWSDLDSQEALRLLRQACPAGAYERPFEYLAQVMGRVTNGNDDYERLGSLIQRQPATQRVLAFAGGYDFYPDDELGPMLENNPRNSELASAVIHLGWRGGITLALLERVGEVQGLERVGEVPELMLVSDF
jgi:hypothetical protein